MPRLDFVFKTLVATLRFDNRRLRADILHYLWRLFERFCVCLQPSQRFEGHFQPPECAEFHIEAPCICTSKRIYVTLYDAVVPVHGDRNVGTSSS